MASKPKSKSNQEPDKVFYEIMVEDWSCEFWFGINLWLVDQIQDYMSERSRITFYGELTAPGLKDIDRANITLSAMPSIDDHWSRVIDERKFPAIGRMEVPPKSTTLDFFCMVPTRAFYILPVAAASNKIEKITIVGSQLKWRKGEALNISITSG